MTEQLSTNNTELTQLQRAQNVVAAFVPKDAPSSYYVYLYLGKASHDATQYEFIDGLCLASKRIWHLDESQTDCVAYVGEGCNGRIGDQAWHPFVPTNSKCRFKLYEGASKADAQELERLLIAELGCILDEDRSDGCLANIRYFHSGSNCCSHLEATSYKLSLNGASFASTTAAAATLSIETYAMAADKTIIVTGSMSELARQFGVSVANISACCNGKLSGIWSRQLDQAIYFCKASDYKAYNVKLMTTRQYSRNRIIIAAKIDGSDICCGTASEIGEYVPEIKQAGLLHVVARGERHSVYGWTCRYVDETSAPVATCGSSLSEFF